MASTSMTLGPHWERFIKEQIEGGRYGSASEVVRAALRELESRTEAVEALRMHLAQGASEADKGVFVDNWSPSEVVARARARRG